MRAAWVLAALLLLPLVPSAPAGAGPAVHDYWVDVGTESAHGLIAYPDGMPSALVVILHGYGHDSSSHATHLSELAARGALAVAMDFRGSGFPLRAGADDSIAATQDLLSRYAFNTTILYSVSMGTAVASMVLSELPVFDYWVDNEGLAMLHETWAGATVLAPANQFAADASRAIETECGGTPATEAACYIERSAALRALEFTSLKGAYITHGLHDGLVPYNQGREMAAALRASGVPTDFYTVVRGQAGGEGTTLTGYGGQQVDGLAGHGSESNDAHTLTALSFGLLYDLVSGTLGDASDRELVLDREFGVLG